MTIAELADFIVKAGAVCGALAAIGLVVMYAFVRPTKNWIIRVISNPVGDIHKEVKPNQGTSMKDDITEIRKRMDALTDNLRSTDYRLNQHLYSQADHSRKTERTETDT